MFSAWAARGNETIPTRDDHDAEGRAPPPPVTSAPRRPRFDFETFEMREHRNESPWLGVSGRSGRPRLQGSRAELSHDARRTCRPGAALGRLFHLDIFRIREGKSREDHIVHAEARARLEQLRELDGAPFVMVVNFQVPGTPPVSMCAYWGRSASRAERRGSGVRRGDGAVRAVHRHPRERRPGRGGLQQPALRAHPAHRRGAVRDRAPAGEQTDLARTKSAAAIRVEVQTTLSLTSTCARR